MKYKDKQIKDICKFIGGSQPPKSEFIHEEREGYVRLIQVRDRLNDNFITYIPEESTTKFCEPDDILIGRYGPPIFQVFRGFKGAYNVAIMKAVPLEGVDKDYLYYFLIQDSVFRYVDSMSKRTAGQTGVELDSLYEYPVKLPDIQGQKKIVSLLKSFDKKIDNNNKIASELLEVAKILFSYWFLQFDFANENGKPYKASGGKMVWNDELEKEIPVGWRVFSLGECLDCNKRTLKNGELSVISYLDTGNLTDNTLGGLSILHEEDGYPSRAKRRISKNDILFSTVRPEQKHYGIIKNPTENMVASTGFTVLSSKFGSIYNDIFYLFITNEKNVEILNTIANSSVSSYPSINSDDILNLKIALPKDIEEIEDLAKIFDSVFSNVSLLQEENKALNALRDFLLPMLMNGQLEFSE